MAPHDVELGTVDPDAMQNDSELPATAVLAFLLPTRLASRTPQAFKPDHRFTTLYLDEFGNPTREIKRPRLASKAIAMVDAFEKTINTDLARGWPVGAKHS
jgi:hypothetical protein